MNKLIKDLNKAFSYTLLKGKTFVPIQPQYPYDRITEMTKRSGISAVLAMKIFREFL